MGLVGGRFGHVGGSSRVSRVLLKGANFKLGMGHVWGRGVGMGMGHWGMFGVGVWEWAWGIGAWVSVGIFCR